MESRSSSPGFPSPGDLQGRIRQRAEEIYLRNGKVPGRDAENWAQAELEIRNEETAHPRSAILVKVNGVQYVGEYRPELAQGYTPGEFRPGMTIPVRFAGQKMFVTRPNGMQLETTIVRTIG